MGHRYRKYSRKVKLYNANMDTFIERLRRVRALNSDPSFFGMDSDAVKKFSFHKVEISTKLL
jgi:hypothetical protein